MFMNTAIWLLRIYPPSEQGALPLGRGSALHFGGDKALFKVKYQETLKRNTSKDAWFSLLSLHAKGADGEPLCVHYRSGSGLADISSSKDMAHRRNGGLFKQNRQMKTALQMWTSKTGTTSIGFTW
ncbi:unnamed protein product [Calypogeia fissa]